MRPDSPQSQPKKRTLFQGVMEYDRPSWKDYILPSTLNTKPYFLELLPGRVRVGFLSRPCTADCNTSKARNPMKGLFAPKRSSTALSPVKLYKSSAP